MPAEDGFVPTPAPLADYLAGELFAPAPDPGDRILYPGSGTGEIAAAVHRRCSVLGLEAPDAVAVERDRQRAETFRERFVGESAPMNHGVPEMSEESRRYHVPSYPVGSSPTEPQTISADVDVRKTDFLLDPPTGTFDYIVANPPYVRYSDIDAGERDLYDRLFDTAEGQFDLYMLFVEQMLDRLAPDGILTFLAPGNYLTKPKGRPLRNLIRRYHPYTPRDVPEWAFPDHKVKTVVTSVVGPEHADARGDRPAETRLYVTYIAASLSAALKDRYGISGDEDREHGGICDYESYRDWLRDAQHRVRRADREDREMLREDDDRGQEKQAQLGAFGDT